MAESIASLLARLDHLAAYEGPWRPLRDAAPLLKSRVAEMRERETRLDDVLIVAIVGGSGVGKSTLLNALAGDELAATSEYRPCTATPTVYHPPGIRLNMGDWHCVSGSALEHLVLIDTPDSDTIVREHREHVIEVLKKSDLILICAGPEKYLDEATWSLLRPLQGERRMVCVETKARPETAPVRDHWLRRLKEEGFDVEQYFRVSARETLDRKIQGEPLDERSGEFAALEAFLRDTLTQDTIRRIKKSNVSGLLRKSLNVLNNEVAAEAEKLATAESRMDALEAKLTGEVLQVIRERFFSQAHLWNYALSREYSLRAKGIVGTLWRVLLTLQTFPARLAGWLPGGRGRGDGHQAARLLTAEGLLEENLSWAASKLDTHYARGLSEAHLTMAEAGFEMGAPCADNASFHRAVAERVESVLQGSGRDRIVRRANLLTSWPVTVLSDAGPLAFVGWTGYVIVKSYFTLPLLDQSFFVHSGAVLTILLALELLLLSWASRALAWSARRAVSRDFKRSLAAGLTLYHTERDALKEIRRYLHDLEATTQAI